MSFNFHQKQLNLVLFETRRQLTPFLLGCVACCYPLDGWPRLLLCAWEQKALTLISLIHLIKFKFEREIT